jgi:hypothetical protein
LSFVVILSPVTAQQTATAVQPGALLQQSLADQLGNAQITDITLTGSARRIAGSDDESGTVTLKALSGGTNRIDLSLSSGPRIEIRSISTSGPSGSWSGPDGVAHAMAYHNVVTDNGLLPLFTISSILSNANSVLTLIGPETRNGQSVIHLAAVQQFPSLTGDSTLMQHLTKMDIYVDATTNLPASLVYNTHPDNNAGIDIPVEITYADYRAANGAQIPFHIQKYLNGSLFLDLQFATANLNSGLSASALSIQ